MSEYFAQDQYKVLDRRCAHAGRHQPRGDRRCRKSELRSLLGCFLFSGDDVFKPLGVLSGGERNRFALARILVSPSNFLLLDEPTNHLDMRAKDVLLEAIEAFSGTVIFVSHDRYFIDRLATRVLEVENGAVTSYPGNYEDYLRRKEALAAGEAEATKGRPQAAAVQASPPPTKLEVLAHSTGAAVGTANGTTIVIEGGFEPAPKERARKLNPIKQKQMEDRVVFLEEETPRIESAIAHTEQQLGVYVSAAETERLTSLASDLRAQLSAMTAEWEELMQQLEAQSA